MRPGDSPLQTGEPHARPAIPPLPPLPGALALAALLLAACGGGGSGSEDLALLASADLDGYVDQMGPAGSPGYSAMSHITTGDADFVEPGWRMQGLVSFDLGPLPAGRKVTRATLRLFQCHIVGDPYATLGDVVLDHVDYGATLEAGDPASILQFAVGVLSSNAVLEWKTLDVTTQVAADLAALRTRSQFRVRFNQLTSDGDGLSDQAKFTDVERIDTEGNPPTLLVTYE